MSFDFGDFNDLADLGGLYQRGRMMEQNQQLLNAINDSRPSGPQCPECGGFIPSGYGTCQHCNTKINWVEDIPCLPGQEAEARAKAQQNQLARQLREQASDDDDAALGGCVLIVLGVAVISALWWIYGDTIVAWLSAAMGFAGRIAPTVLAIGVGCGVLVFLWKIRKRFYSLVLNFHLVDREDGETTDSRHVYQTLLRSLCCMMAADGKIVADEIKAAKQVLKHLDSPLSETEVANTFAEFRTQIRNDGFEKVMKTTIESIQNTLADDNFRSTFRRVLKQIAEADGDIDTQEKKAAKQMLAALGS
ncbi:MAG: TerB family tellurite resistance protein [Planctomycetota bacterium]|nr:TerB family tellurite resistance protein [Planctomycetota bacterium]